MSFLPKARRTKDTFRPIGSRYPRHRPTHILICLALLALILVSCAGENSFYIQGDRAQKKELQTLFSLLNEHGPSGAKPDNVARFATARKIAALLIADGRKALAASFLLDLSDPADEYAPWYIFSAAAAYESAGDLPLAIPLYERLIKTQPDLLVEGSSLHYQALIRLVRSNASPERKIEYYRDLVVRFPEALDIGASHFLLAKEYEKTGQWKEAMNSYAAYLPYFGSQVPGYPEAFSYARQLLEFNASSKDWTYESLDDLLEEIRKALTLGSARQLRRYASKAGFFAISWYQDSDMDANSKVAFDLGQFMQGRRIYASPELHPSSGPYEAYLRTWGWTGRINVWYLYFRKINFPADPAVHGRWEWAGIYFGERMQ
ncbi:MAG: tetratricopeptide repeat protein [Spirochaetia bacterium]|nr:tetratricopeptide repeat protein [Spirochaetia bacterium]